MEAGSGKLEVGREQEAGSWKLEAYTPRVRTWVKWTIAAIASVVLVVAALGATGAYFALRHLDTRTATEAEAQRDGESIRSRYAGRAPLVEVVDAKTGDIRINRATAASARPVDTIHVLTWKAEDGQLLRTQVPLWLMRFSTVQLASTLGIAPERFRLTVGDIQRYGPGIVLDYKAPHADRVLIWVE